MNFIRRIFGGVQPTYLIRAYLIGLLFFALMIGMALGMETKDGMPIGLIVFAALSALLFPFAKLVWDELRDLAFGNNVIFMNAILLFMFKWFINGLLWAFSILIAPFGLLYLWFRTRQTAEDRAS